MMCAFSHIDNAEHRTIDEYLKKNGAKSGRSYKTKKTWVRVRYLSFLQDLTIKTTSMFKVNIFHAKYFK